MDDFLKVFAKEISDIATSDVNNGKTNNDHRKTSGNFNGNSNGTLKLKRDNKDLKSPRSSPRPSPRLSPRQPQHQSKSEPTPVHNTNHNSHTDMKQEKAFINPLASPSSRSNSATEDDRNGQRRSDELDNISIASSALPGMLTPSNLTPRKNSQSTTSGKNSSSTSTTPRKNTATSYTSRDDGSNSEDTSHATPTESVPIKRGKPTGRSKSVTTTNNRKRSTSLSRKTSMVQYIIYNIYFLYFS